MVNQYDVMKVNLNPVKGNEKGKYRPCVVVSDTDFNNKVNIVWVLPVTSREKAIQQMLLLKQWTIIFMV